jgi:D-alanyl-D-alanine carboxypeptidase
MIRILTLLLILSASNTLWAQIPQAVTNKLNNTYDSICTKLNIKGSSASILVPNMGIWKRSFGISHIGKPTSTEMLFTLGSNTKTYTAAVILKLDQLKMLSLDDTIGKWFSNVPNVNGKATVRQLLNHTSGIASYTDNNTFWTEVFKNLDKPWTPEEIFPYITAPTFAPGANWAYSNSNYLLAGIIITKVANSSLAASYKNYIFSPAGLTKTFLLGEETTNIDVAHHWSISIGNPFLTDWEAQNLSYLAMDKVSWAAGGLYGTAEDNVQFWNALFHTKTIIADSMLTKMKVARNIGGGMAYGLGVFSLSGFNGRTVYSHGGSNLGGRNENIYDPISGYSISVLTNQDSISNNTILTQLVRNLHKNLLDLKVGVKEDDIAIDKPIHIYPNPSNGSFTIYLSNQLAQNEATITIIDINGKKVYEASSALHSAAQTVNIDMNSLQAGMYFVQVKSAANTFSQKIILNK